MCKLGGTGSTSSSPCTRLDAGAHCALQQHYVCFCDCQLFGHAASEVKSILEDDAASVNKESDNYWVLTAALKRYIDNEGKGQLPIEVCMAPLLHALMPCDICTCQQGCSDGNMRNCCLLSVLY